MSDWGGFGGKGWNGGGKGWGGGGFGGGGGWNQFMQFDGGKGKGKDNRKKIDPSRTIWVGNIPEGTQFQELKAHVELSGVQPLWAEVYSGKGAGTGAIGFKTDTEAQEAIMVLNGTVFKGVTLAFDVWGKGEGGGSGRSGRSGPSGGKGWNGGGGKSWGGGGGKGWSGGASYSSPGGVWNQFLKWNSGKGKGKDNRKKIDPSRTIWVGNIPEGTQFQELKAHVELSGVQPLWAEVYSGKGAGTGAIGFKTSNEGHEAIMVLNGTVFKGVTLAFDAWEKQRK